MYQMTPPQPPRKPQKKIHLWQILLILAAMVGAGWYLYTMLAPVASPYGVITAGTLGSRYSGDVLIVRNETPYDAEGVTSIDYVAEEGTVVRRGSTICKIYSSGYSTREMNNLQTYRNQIKTYQLSLTSAETTYDAKMAEL